MQKVSVGRAVSIDSLDHVRAAAFGKCCAPEDLQDATASVTADFPVGPGNLDERRMCSTQRSPLSKLSRTRRRPAATGIFPASQSPARCAVLGAVLAKAAAAVAKTGVAEDWGASRVTSVSRGRTSSAASGLGVDARWQCELPDGRSPRSAPDDVLGCRRLEGGVSDVAAVPRWAGTSWVLFRPGILRSSVQIHA